MRKVSRQTCSFFDRKPAREAPWTQDLWIYDLRTNHRFTLKTNPMRREHLDDFVTCFNADDRHQREETERFRRFSYAELERRDNLQPGHLLAARRKLWRMLLTCRHAEKFYLEEIYR